MLDLHASIAALAEHRPVFHSEADFQHAFAWELHLQFPSALVRLERPVESPLGPLHIDLVAEFGDRLFAFELKYKTRAMVTQLGSELFVLRDQGAQPLGRYDFLKDLQRLELLGKAFPRVTAFAVLLTNDSAYWSEARGGDDTSAAFSLCDGRTVSGCLDWGARTSPGTKRNRERPIELGSQYSLKCRDYSNVEAKYYHRFRYLALQLAAPVLTA